MRYRFGWMATVLFFVMAICPVSLQAKTESAPRQKKAGIKSKAVDKAGTRKPKPPRLSSKSANPKATSKASASGLIPGGDMPTLVSEADLRKEVARARAALSSDPKNRAARDRLVNASIVTVDWLLAAEAVGNVAKVDRLSSLLKKDLADVGWRVRRLAENGDVRARQAQGYLWASDQGNSENPARACVEFRAAASELPASAWRAAMCDLDAKPAEAWRQIEAAATRGHAIAQEWMGRRCLGEFASGQKDAVCARNWLSQSASQGRPKSQTLLAYLLTSGQGGADDISRGVRLYRLAAEQGDPDAENNLGELYESGRGIEKNLPEALKWYERAAERGLGAAQFNAGRVWAIGVDGKADSARARAWLIKAEEKGINQSRQVLDWLDSSVATSR